MQSNTVTLARIQSRVKELATLIQAPDDVLPTFGTSEDSARPHVEVVGELPYYVVVERGRELVREGFVDEHALLERIFGAVTFAMALRFEVQNRRGNEDGRRLLFARKLELLARLDPKWSERERACLLEILRVHPFSDDLQPRDTIGSAT
jgi:hypothetical protein